MKICGRWKLRVTGSPRRPQGVLAAANLLSMAEASEEANPNPNDARVARLTDARRLSFRPPPPPLPPHPRFQRRAHLFVEHEQVLDALAFGGEGGAAGCRCGIAIAV